MSEKFCPFTKEACSPDCALYFHASPAQNSMCIFMYNHRALKGIENGIGQLIRLRPIS